MKTFSTLELNIPVSESLLLLICIKKAAVHLHLLLLLEMAAILPAPWRRWRRLPAGRAGQMVGPNRQEAVFASLQHRCNYHLCLGFSSLSPHVSALHCMLITAGRERSTHTHAVRPSLVQTNNCVRSCSWLSGASMSCSRVRRRSKVVAVKEVGTASTQLRFPLCPASVPPRVLAVSVAQAAQ